jgi:hypothetical protein
VNLDSIEPCFQRTLDRSRKSSLEVFDVLQSHLLRFGMGIIPRNRARSVNVVWPAVQLFSSDCSRRQPWRHGARFPACVPQLDHHLLTLAVSELDHFVQVLDLTVLPETHVFGSDAALRSDRSSFDTGNSWSALDDAAHVLEVYQRVTSLGVRLGITYSDVPHGVVAIVSRVLAQRRERDAVVESETTELERLEQLRDALGLFGDQSSTCWRVLSRGEVRDARRCFVDIVRLLLDVRLQSEGFKSALCLRHHVGLYLSVTHLDGMVRGHIGWCC